MIFGFLPQNLKTLGGGHGFHYALAAAPAAGRIMAPGAAVLPLLRAGQENAQMIPGWP
jgi:hypothetical protein